LVADGLHQRLQLLRVAPGDARQEQQVIDLFARIEGEVGALEAVIFNVGANVWFPITETTERVYRKVWEMAAFGGFLTGREAARVMLPRQ
ncbi:SDR family NAD(P)-dependent oxidoreductase, partial [Pseudomonas aeruginosa]